MDSRQAHDSEQIPPSETAQPSQVSAETDPMERFLNESPREEAWSALPKSDTSRLDSSESWRHLTASFEPFFPHSRHRTLKQLSWQEPASRSAVSVEQKSAQGFSPSLLDEDESMSDSSSNPDDTLDEFIVNPRRYHDRLAALRKKTTLNSSLFTIMEGKSSTRDVEAALNAPVIYSSLPNVVEGMDVGDLSLFV